MSEKQYILAIQPENKPLRYTLAYATAITLKGETKLAWAECGSTAILWVEGDDWLVGAYPLEDMVEMYESKHELDRLNAEVRAASVQQNVVAFRPDPNYAGPAKPREAAEKVLAVLEKRARELNGKIPAFCIITNKPTRLSVKFVPGGGMEYRFGDYECNGSEAMDHLVNHIVKSGKEIVVHG